jgi:hypothetical protein
MVNIIQKGDLSAQSFANDNTLNLGGITVRVDAGSVVGDAIAAAVAAIPADNFLQGLGGYNAGTNTLTLNMDDGSTVDVDLTGLLADAQAEQLAALRSTEGVQVLGNDGTTLLGYLVAP